MRHALEATDTGQASSKAADAREHIKIADQSMSSPITMYLRSEARQPAVSLSASLPKLLE